MKINKYFLNFKYFLFLQICFTFCAFLLSDYKFAQLVHLSIAYRQRSSAFDVCGELQLQHGSISVSVLNLRNLKLL